MSCNCTSTICSTRGRIGRRGRTIMLGKSRIYFRDLDISAYSNADGELTIAADSKVTVAGRDIGTDGAKLDTIATNANNYTHPNHTGDITSVGDGATLLANNAVTNAKMANMSAATIKGRQTGGGAGDPEDLTKTQALAILNVEDGADVTDAANVSSAGAVMDSDITTNGLVARTASGSYSARTIQGGTGISLTNGDGVSGNPSVSFTTTTRRMSLLHGQTFPDNSGGVFPVPLSYFGTNDKWGFMVYGFANTVGGAAGAWKLHSNLVVPSDIDNTVDPPWIIEWSSTVTTGNVVFGVALRGIGGDDTESFDQATSVQDQTVTDAAPSAAHEKMKATITPTGSNFVAGETLEVYLYRDSSNASDTLAGSVYVVNFDLEYTIS